jgi:CubicO group peptidase (beta-lactamase class C family)
VDYGYLWQRGSTLIGDELITAYWASGNGGQYIIILPDVAMVVVFTGGNYNSPLAGQPFGMLTKYILPAFLHPKHQKTITLKREYLSSLTGNYSLDFEPTVTATIDVFQNNLRLLSPDNEYVELTPISNTIFNGESSLYGPLSVQFIENIQGEIIRLITYGSFSNYTFEKN